MKAPKSKFLIEGVIVLLASAALIPVGVYWLSSEPGMLLLMVNYPWNAVGIVLGPAVVAVIAGFVISRIIGNKKAFWTVFRPAFYICWGLAMIEFVVMTIMA